MSFIKSIAICTLLVAGTLLFSCNDNKQYSAYQCPMKCEGEKTYPKEGECPVCNMDLEGVETLKKNQ